LCDPEAVATDNKGNIYGTGSYEGGVSFGSYTVNTSIMNEANTFLTKYDAAGNVLWAESSTVPRGGCFGEAYSVATDNFGNIYVTGQYQDTVTFGGYTLRTGYNRDNFFIVKYNSNGNVVWAKDARLSKYGLSVAQGLSVTTDMAGDIYATGSYTDTTSFGPYMLGDNGVFLVKYDGSGNVLWVKSPKSWNTSTGNSVTTDGFGNVYITGLFSDSIEFGTNVLSGIGGQSNMFLAKYDSAGNVLWAKSPVISGTYGFGLGEALVTDSVGNVYVAGDYSHTVIFGSDTFKSPYSSVFLAKYNFSGNILWAKSSKLTGSSYGANCYSLAINKWQYIYISGSFPDTVTFDSLTLSSKSVSPSFIIKFDTSGKAICGTVVDNYNDDANGVAPDPFGDNVYFIGDFENTVNDSSCVFGNTTLSGRQIEWAFLAKWTCSPCLVTPSINKPGAICQGDSIQLSARGGTGFNWAPSGGLSSTAIYNPVASPSVSTTYTVTVNYWTCSAKDSVVVYVNPVPAFTACCDTTLQAGQSVQLTSSGGGAYYWTPSVGLSCNACANPQAYPNRSTIYTLTVTSDSGCSVSQTVTIDVICGAVFIPEAFSPNGDGQNDILYVRGDCIRTMQFDVFDRWGSKVFETNDKNVGWNGAYKGEAMNSGSYVYYLNAIMYDGTTVTKKGNVTLVR
jgi:gliding motility-associated-like protein